MSHPGEIFLQPFLSEQVKSGLKATASTFGSYGIENPGIGQPGRVKFTTEATILRIEEETFRRQNTILGLLGDDTGALQEMTFNPDSFCSNVGPTILLEQGFAKNLNRFNGFNLEDRGRVSDEEVAMFEVSAAKQLEIVAKSVEVRWGSFMLLGEYRKFLDEFARSHPEMEQALAFPDRFEEIISGSRNELSARIKGLQVTLFDGEQSLFTINKVFDQAIRFVLAHKMFPKYESLMTQKHTWFRPSNRMKAGIILDSQKEEDKDELFAALTFNDTKELLGLYTSGEMGLRYLDLIPGKPVEITKNLVGGLNDKMRKSSSREVEIDYSGYEFAGIEQSKKESGDSEIEELEWEESDIYSQPRKKKSRNTQEQ